MRLLRLLAAIFSISLRRELAFRANLLFQAGTTGAGIAASLAALGIVYSQTTTLGGWDLGAAIVLLGTYEIVSGMLATFVEPNVAWLGEQVKSGQFDQILLKPVPSIFLASLGSCAPLGLSRVLLGLAVLGFGLHECGTIPTVAGVAGWLLLLGTALGVTWASRVLLASIALWAPSVALDVVYSALWQLGRYPVSIYRQPLRFALTYILPVAFIASIPARALTAGLDPPLLLAGLVAGGVAITVARLVWVRGLRRYTSATS